MQWLRKAAENGLVYACLLHTGPNVHADACMYCMSLAGRMYHGRPYAREVGHVGQAAGVAMSAGVMAGHDVPPDVLTDVIYWLRKGGRLETNDALDLLRLESLVGNKYCWNETCHAVGLLKEFKVCPQCKVARYCDDTCQQQDWTPGGHKETCGSCASFRHKYDN